MTNYRGRFAPTPSGDLHSGSLLVAMVSYAEAKSCDGQWFIRIDDIDQSRVKKDAEKSILGMLEKLGFQWDGKIEYQHNDDMYKESIDQLNRLKLLYPCYCSRKKLKSLNLQGSYPGFCRKHDFPAKDDLRYAVRLKTNHNQLNIKDLVQGQLSMTLCAEKDDFILQRSDSMIAYQLATVIDDDCININSVVRGYDLVDSSFKQLYLYQLLNLLEPDYLHVPLLLDKAGKKLSKSSGSAALKGRMSELYQLAILMGQNLPLESDMMSLDDFWTALLSNWNREQIPKVSQIKLNL